MVCYDGFIYESIFVRNALILFVIEAGVINRWAGGCEWNESSICVEYHSLQCLHTNVYLRKYVICGTGIVPL